MNTTEPRLGVDYMLGNFLAPNEEARTIRLTASQARTDVENKGVDAFYETGRATKAKKFWLVPVPETGDPVAALREEIRRLEAWKASFPICTTCSQRRSKDPQAPCPTCWTKQDGTTAD